MFTNVQEASQKLANTVVLFQNKPFLVTDIGGLPNATPVVSGFPLPSGDPLILPITDTQWEFKNLGSRLGYINVEYKEYRQSVWSRRVPIRKAAQTQGLSAANVKISRLYANPTMGLQGTALMFQTLIRIDGFKRAFLRDYPSLEQAAKVIDRNPEVTSMAFDRLLSIRRSNLGLFYLCYKGQDIGYTEDVHTFRVAKQFRYLDELLVEEQHLHIQ